MKRSLKIPTQSDDYPEWSDYVKDRINRVIQHCIKSGDNKIFIYTNLKRGLPLENINKVAGPFVEAWAQEKFEAIAEDAKNEYELINVESGVRLAPYDIILQFKRREEVISANIDVKATAQDIPNSGRSPNITSYGRIRTEYVNDPDYIFIILSLKHKVYSEKAKQGMTNGIMEVVNFIAFDLKHVSEKDMSYNPALGTGQIQIRDINYVTEVQRTTWEFCQMLDEKYIKSKGEEAWKALATKLGWFEGTEAAPEATEVLL